jgi:tetratricopeptide (TPR) repeat protein
VGGLLRQTGDNVGALASFEEQRELAERLAAEQSTDAAQSIVASSHQNIGVVLHWTGKTEEALMECRQALAIQQKLADANPAVTQFQSNLAASHSNIGVVLVRTGKSEEAQKYIEEILQLLKAKLGPEHPATLVALDAVAGVYLAVAAQQAWLGQEQEWAATCERGLSLARDTKSVRTVERVAKLCSLRPSDDNRRRAALLLARRAVELGKGDHYLMLAWFQVALGMAEYRSAHFAQADAALLAAMGAGKSDYFIGGTSAFYRALSLFRQGKPDEARQLATQAAAKMKPLPKDAKNLLASETADLLLWLAYREAKETIKFEEKSGAGAEPEARNKAKPSTEERPFARRKAVPECLPWVCQPPLGPAGSFYSHGPPRPSPRSPAFLYGCHPRPVNGYIELNQLHCVYYATDV